MPIPGEDQQYVNDRAEAHRRHGIEMTRAVRESGSAPELCDYIRIYNRIAGAAQRQLEEDMEAARAALAERIESGLEAKGLL